MYCPTATPDPRSVNEPAVTGGNDASLTAEKTLGGELPGSLKPKSYTENA